MNAVGSIQAVSAAERWEAVQAAMAGPDHPVEAPGASTVPGPQASLPAVALASDIAPTDPALMSAPVTEGLATAVSFGFSGPPALAAPADTHHAPAQTPQAADPAQPHAHQGSTALPVHPAHPAHPALQARASAPGTQQTAPNLPASSASPAAAPPWALAAEPLAAALPMVPALLSPMRTQDGERCQWRLSERDAAPWRTLFERADDGEGDADNDADDDTDADADTRVDRQDRPAEVAPGDAHDDPGLNLPPWATDTLSALQMASQQADAAEALRPAVQAWRAARPVLLASPAGLAMLCPTRDARQWQARRWPARWRQARPSGQTLWWVVRLGLSPQGLPRTLRTLAPPTVLPPGRVSCALRFDGASASLAHWTEVLVQTPASPSLRALLGHRPSLPWLLCNRPLWALETR